MAIILIIAAIAIPNLLRARMAANEASALGSIRTVNTSAVTLAPVSRPIQSLAYQQPSDRLDRVVSLAMRVALNNQEGRDVSPLFLFLPVTSAERTLPYQTLLNAIRLGKMPDQRILLLIQDANYPVISLAQLF